MFRVLTRRKESRKRNLNFHLPVAVPLNPTLRLLANDSSYVTMQHIYDEHCDTMRIAREDPQLAFAEKFENVYSPSVCLQLLSYFITDQHLLALRESSDQSPSRTLGRDQGQIGT